MSLKLTATMVALAVSAILLGAAGHSMAALNAVSGTPNPAADRVLAGGSPAAVAVSLANGFPLWYEDTPGGLKLELCLDQATATPDGIIAPCLTAQPFVGSPISFPLNFGPEAFYWSATAFENRVATVGGVSIPWSALLVLAQEAAFANGITSEGEQVAFGRIRIRIVVPTPGTYRVTHPYGTRDYVVTAQGAERDINQTQDIGILAANNFLVSLGDRDLAAEPLPLFPQPTPPALNFAPNGVIDAAGKSIGPFLRPVTPVVVANNGNRYLADPGTDLLPKTVAVTGGPFGNVFSIELVGDSAGNIGPAFIPAGVVLNPGNGSQLATIDQFQVSGKIFNDGPNTPPVAGPLNVATSKNRAVSIDVIGAVSDVTGATNVHGVNPQALGIYVSPVDIRRTTSFTTAAGGTVVRFTNATTGQTTFTYTPANGFTGTDTFQYVVQDTGGLVSAPALVAVLVEDLTVSAASYRQKHGRWLIEGRSSDLTGNTVTVRSDPVALLSGSSETTPVASPAKGFVALALAKDAIDFRLNIAPLPTSTVSAVHIHLGAPGTNGPIIFSLYDSLDGPFSSSISGRLDFGNLQQPPGSGIQTFTDALNAILAGNTYVNVHTAANVSGEIRGQLLGQTVGTAAVTPDGTWSVPVKSTASPFGVKGVHATSSNGVTLVGIPLQVR